MINIGYGPFIKKTQGNMFLWDMLVKILIGQFTLFLSVILLATLGQQVFSHINPADLSVGVYVF